MAAYSQGHHRRPGGPLTFATLAGAWRPLLNFVVFQAAWFACVAAAADGYVAWGMAAIGAAVLLHFALSDSLRTDALLTGIALGLGLAWDTLAMQAGWIAYASPGPVAGVAPAWILGLWALFATTLRQPMRWLHGRPWLAALLGAVGGPLSYAAAARMGACSYEGPASLAALGFGWALLMPLLLAVTRRLEMRREPARALA